MAAALAGVQLGFQLGGKVAAIILLCQEEFDRQRGAVLVCRRRAFLGDLLGETQDLRIQLGADGADCCASRMRGSVFAGPVYFWAGFVAAGWSTPNSRASRPGLAGLDSLGLDNAVTLSRCGYATKVLAMLTISPVT